MSNCWLGHILSQNDFLIKSLSLSKTIIVMEWFDRGYLTTYNNSLISFFPFFWLSFRAVQALNICVCISPNWKLWDQLSRVGSNSCWPVYKPNTKPTVHAECGLPGQWTPIMALISYWLFCIYHHFPHVSTFVPFTGNSEIPAHSALWFHRAAAADPEFNRFPMFDAKPTVPWRRGREKGYPVIATRTSWLPYSSYPCYHDFDYQLTITIADKNVKEHKI